MTNLQADHGGTLAGTQGLSTTLPGQLTGGLMLTNISPLTDRSKLQPASALDNVVTGLHSYGYQVGWNHGCFQVSPVKGTLRPADAPATLTLDDFMGGQTRPRETFLYKPKAQSTLTFSKGPLRPTTPQNTQSPTVPAHRPPAPRTPPQQPPTPSTRFHRLAQSVDTLQSLQVPVGHNVNADNLRSLTYSTTHDADSPLHPSRPCTPLQRPSTAPEPSQAAPPPPADTHYMVQMYQTQHGSAQQDRGAQEDGACLVQRPGTPPPAWAGSTTPAPRTPTNPPQQSRPATPIVNLNKDAREALRPTTPGTPPSRPCTTRPSTARSTFNAKTFRPSRGQALVVFQHMDKDKNGKVTLSELEDAALAVGFSLEQAHRLFHKMDKDGKGYLAAKDWGERDMAKVVELFSLVYMQRFMGLPGPTTLPEQVTKYLQLQELKAVRSMSSAIQMARANAVLRGAHSPSGSGNVIYEAFRFMDTDNSGELSFDELRDGFYALGVYIKDDVMRQMMNLFDADHDGHVNYHEFVSKMFPAQKNLQ